VTAEIEQVLDATTADPRLGTRIAGVAMDTFAASLVSVDAAGRPLTPCLTYADSRCSAAVTALRAELDEWLQVLADVLGRPVTHVTRRRATQRGAALLALDALAPDVPRAERVAGATYEPRPAHVDHYAERRARFAEVYDALLRG